MGTMKASHEKDPHNNSTVVPAFSFTNICKLFHRTNTEPGGKAQQNMGSKRRHLFPQ